MYNIEHCILYRSDTMKLYSTVPIIEGVMQNIGNPTLLEMNFIYWDYKEESKFFVIPVYWEYK